MPETYPTSSPSNRSWLQEHLRTLVTAPNEHFDRLFTRDATGVIAGKSVGREGIKAALLALHMEWSANSCRFGPATCLDGFVATHCDFMPRHACEYTEVVATALIKPEGCISSLELDGEESLFGHC
ncbi:uncharacterized protein C8Q71DRAFT_786286 [Rhodofomes roseus]|uniref:SnoaL-like domain-containing protein n=1 Tax=Rhodofomes roseus TaxID=34475 RepID=A0ABQ8K1F0_9APHY|nr:uncharacterized protein C8Q71DRAFT_786286 [Rhodofomes roseus]KAH9830532.1 hypothetical protein C8Q71DRAFT_786286 [Rhodofomes roseus]